MKWYVIKNQHWKSQFEVQIIKRGWGNGYVAIPPSHPAYKMYPGDNFVYDSCVVHGGLTHAAFGDGIDAPKDWWVFGFDTNHFGDTIENWPKEAVIEETMNLFWQLVELEWGGL
jgi:hypothetical protein